MTTCREILAWCDDILQTAQFKDYAPNGLQIEGAEKINKIVAAVTASRSAVECAAQQGAQLLLVHHGMFWKSEPATITGWKKQRIATLLHHNINMAGYHLPLDAHPELGNNAQLAKTDGLANRLHLRRAKPTEHRPSENPENRFRTNCRNRPKTRRREIGRASCRERV